MGYLYLFTLYLFIRIVCSVSGGVDRYSGARGRGRLDESVSSLHRSPHHLHHPLLHALRRTSRISTVCLLTLPAWCAEQGL